MISQLSTRYDFDNEKFIIIVNDVHDDDDGDVPMGK